MSSRPFGLWFRTALVAFALAAPVVAANGNPHGALASECTECHTTTQWVPLAKSIPFRHESVGQRLEGAHATANCRQCHLSLVFSQVGTACQDCHRDAHAGELGTRCTACHDTRSWSNQREMFDRHARTLFPLLATHARVDCAACHGGQRATEFAATPTECVACHRRDADAVVTPSHRGFSSDCTGCHGQVPDSWQGAGFAHSTSFPLVGGHANVGCRECHKSQSATPPSDCVSCHRPDYEGTRDPNHVSGGFPTDCQRCHTIAAWRPASTFDHASAGFALEGAHRAVACSSCHKNGYAGTPRDCYSCHRSSYEGTRDPNHASAGFSTSCQQCHTTSAWRPAQSFDHATTSFALDGAHRNVACSSCHKSGYAGTPKDCYSCHRANYEGTRDPNHVSGGFSTSCQQCHTTSAWRPAQSFDHSRTAFPLDGAHRSVGCTSCHTNGYAGTPKDCYSCHRANYEGTRDPNHVSGSFSTTCQQCHTTSAWRPAQNFDHSRTAFPLDGAHRSVGCTSCHTSGYAGTPKDCYSCHRSNYEGTRDPNHVSGGFSTSCQQCHTTSAWRPAQNFDHSRTAFPLNGAHRSVGCTSCHRNGYAGTPKDCYSCHRTNYEGTRNPNHVQQGFPTTCQQCHSENAWQPASFDHSRTAFPLEGAHRSITCTSCHTTVYAGTPKDCYVCHRSAFEGTRNPNHVQAAFPTTCLQCHSQSAWQPATFNHGSTRFPLTGAHVSVACSACHTSGYAGTPRDCYSCHQRDYQQAQPNHASAGFPTTCETCHTTSRWDGASFDHDGRYFPIYSGRHRTVWGNNCSTCHVAAGNFQVFECILCHEHSQQNTDREHREVNGYRWESRACYQCHPRGQGD